jgi:hypothetical protein
MVAEMFRIRWYSISGKYGNVMGMTSPSAVNTSPRPRP